MNVTLGNENIGPDHLNNKTKVNSKSARRNGLYLTNKELNEYNLGRNKFGAQLSLSDIITNQDTTDSSFTIHQDDPPVNTNRFSNQLLEEDEDEEGQENELTATLSNNSSSTINKRTSIPYVNNRFSSTSSYNGSSVRNSKRFSMMSSSSDSDVDDENEEDEDFNRCFFNNPNGRTRNLTTISIHSNSSNESVGFRNSTGGKPGLAGYDSTNTASNGSNSNKAKKKAKQKQKAQQAQQQMAYKRQSAISTTSLDRKQRFSQISAASSDKRFSQISSASSDRSSKRFSMLGSTRIFSDQTQQQQQRQHPESHRAPVKVAPFVAPQAKQQQLQAQQQQVLQKQQQQQQQQQKKQQPVSNPQQTQPQAQPAQAISQPSSSRIHRLMHSVSIRSGLFKAKDPNQPEEKKVQMKRSFFSIRSGLNRSASTLDIGNSNFDRNNISLPVPQDQTAKKIDNRLKNSSSIYSLASRR